ncbi:NAD(P)/FAD-dependent oxidoreductase [Mycetocola tolaasinivorans]|uniref:NAD(P)/FAD-dependent oxidoreductase n=1 Tax=Mycetocola tolaasinivorans TaxID=76635 RepID=A0A3L7ACN5_9MICO|nr:NAD(P)/FAD-dependent oxidoreductase [Mycetocola tolaasinivorans]RLP77987.1 NAD(P)/FAD-dependent oxidoreductase [Mycetocola tolaasinivorans]
MTTRHPASTPPFGAQSPGAQIPATAPETDVDVVIVGGGAGGLSAALTLARARRRTLVIDAGAPRNAPAAGAHGLLGLEGIPPLELLERGRAEVRAYGGDIRPGTVSDIEASPGGHHFTVHVGEGAEHVAITARRIILATGLTDELPDIPGVRERWGREVLHCPYCHGWEVRDQPIGILATGPNSVHQARLFHQWSRDIVFFTREQPLAAETREEFAALGIRIIEAAVAGLDIADDALAGVRLEDGTLVPRTAVVVAPAMHANVAACASLNLAITEIPMGTFITADPTGQTSTPGVWVVGNAADLGAQVGAAAAAGVRASAVVNAHLVDEDAAAAVRERQKK